MFPIAGPRGVLAENSIRGGARCEISKAELQ